MRLREKDLPEEYDSPALGRSSRVLVQRQVDVFLQYRAFIRSGVILDWGCRHAT